MYKHDLTINQPFVQAQKSLMNALQHAELSIVSEIDMQDTMKKKLDKNMRPYHIYGACSAPLAARILDAEPDAGVLLPCTVILREINDEQSVVCFMSPTTVFGLANNNEIDTVATLAEAKIEQAIAALSVTH